MTGKKNKTRNLKNEASDIDKERQDLKILESPDYEKLQLENKELKQLFDKENIEKEQYSNENEQYKNELISLYQILSEKDNQIRLQKERNDRIIRQNKEEVYKLTQENEVAKSENKSYSRMLQQQAQVSQLQQELDHKNSISNKLELELKIKENDDNQLKICVEIMKTLKGVQVTLEDRISKYKKIVSDQQNLITTINEENKLLNRTKEEENDKLELEKDEIKFQNNSQQNQFSELKKKLDDRSNELNSQKSETKKKEIQIEDLVHGILKNEAHLKHHHEQDQSHKKELDRQKNMIVYQDEKLSEIGSTRKKIDFDFDSQQGSSQKL